MVSHIEIAQKENVSIKEIHERANALNKTYFLDVFKSGCDQKWHGAIWQKQDCSACHKDECKCVKLVYAFQDGFQTPAQAACDLNSRLDGTKLTSAEEKQCGLSSSDLGLLAKLAIKPTHMDKAQAFQLQKAHERALY